MTLCRRASRVLPLAVASLVVLAPATALSRAASLGLIVTLQVGAPATAGKSVSFTASTSETLSGAGGHYALELRGIDLTRTPRATYTRPDYLDKRRCIAQPCKWSVTANTTTTYEFQVFLIDLRSGKSAGQSPPVQAAWEPPPRPHGLKLLFNGKSFPGAALVGGADNYHNIPAGTLTIVARWTDDARGTGYSVVISTTEPFAHDYVVCSTGTSCTVPKTVRILIAQEVSWTVRLLKGKELVTGFKVCLTGRA